MGTGFSKQKKQMRAMQEQFKTLQAEMKQKSFVGSSSAGLVQVTLNGDGDLIALDLKPECVDKEDIDGLKDLIIQAHKAASDQIKQQSNMALPF